MEEWLWLLSRNDIAYEYTDKHIQSAVQRVKVVMRDEYFNYQKSLRDEKARDFSLNFAFKAIKERDGEIKKRVDEIKEITMIAIKALCPTPDNKEEIASKLHCPISMVESVMKQSSKRLLTEDGEEDASGG